MIEEIKLKEGANVYDAVITFEMDYEDGTKLIMSNLLWSMLVFLIALLV